MIGVGCEEAAGWANVFYMYKEEKISHIGPMGGYKVLLIAPLIEMSDDRPTAAHVHTKGDRMDHTSWAGTWNPGWGPYARISASRTTAIWYRYNTAAASTGQSQ